MVEKVCTNLKHWKVKKKKSFGRCIGFPGRAGRTGGEKGGPGAWTQAGVALVALGPLQPNKDKACTAQEPSEMRAEKMSLENNLGPG